MRRRKSELQIERHFVQARMLFTVQPTDMFWDDGLVPWGKEIKGAIIRVLPPAQATAEQLDDLRKKLFALEVLKVNVLPKQPGEAVVLQPEELIAESGIREVVEDMVVEANTRDRAALHDVIERALVEAKL